MEAVRPGTRLRSFVLHKVGTRRPDCPPILQRSANTKRRKTRQCESYCRDLFRQVSAQSCACCRNSEGIVGGETLNEVGRQRRTQECLHQLYRNSSRPHAGLARLRAGAHAPPALFFERGFQHFQGALRPSRFAPLCADVVHHSPKLRMFSNLCRSLYAPHRSTVAHSSTNCVKAAH